MDWSELKRHYVVPAVPALVLTGFLVVLGCAIWLWQDSDTLWAEPIESITVKQTGLSTGEFIREFEYGQHHYTVLYSRDGTAKGLSPPILLDKRPVEPE